MELKEANHFLVHRPAELVGSCTCGEVIKLCIYFLWTLSIVGMKNSTVLYSTSERLAATSSGSEEKVCTFLESARESNLLSRMSVYWRRASFSVRIALNLQATATQIFLGVFR
jgi:hypothetical protein